VRLLLLAGTSEARRIAEGLAEMPGVAATASLAGATRAPRSLAVPTRVGGFGGEAGFRAALVEGRFDAVIDATHPFAQVMSDRAARVCASLGLPCLHVLRPEWVAGPGDRWVEIGTEGEAARVIPPGARVFVATGRQTLDRLANMGGRELIVRQIDPPDGPFPFPNGRFLLGRAPFAVEEEVALFRDLRIDWLLVKNAGGAASRPKLDAARQLGLPVAMVRRPPPPEGRVVPDAEAALDWVRGLTCG